MDLDASDNIVVDMVANVTDSLLEKITTSGGQVLYVNRALRSIRAIIPPEQIENIAASPEVIFISPKQGSMTQGNSSRAHQSDAVMGSGARLRTESGESSPQLAKNMSSPGVPQIGQGSVETEGDYTHRAVDARGTFGVDGTGLKSAFSRTVLQAGLLARPQAIFRRTAERRRVLPCSPGKPGPAMKARR